MQGHTKKGLAWLAGHAFLIVAFTAAFSCAPAQVVKDPHGKGTGYGSRGAGTVVKVMLDRTVRINATLCKSSTGEAELGHSGSGVILYSTGRVGVVATAKHVIDRNCLYTITDSEGHKTYGTMPSLHKTLDVGILTSIGLKKVQNVKKAHPYLGEPIFALGHPFDLLKGQTWLTVTRGVAAAEYEDGTFRFTAPIYPGNSGGPIFDRRGNLVGIISAAMFRMGAPIDGMYYAVNAAALDELLMSPLGEGHSHHRPKKKAGKVGKHK